MGRGGRLCEWRGGDGVVLFCLARSLRSVLGPLVRHGRGGGHPSPIGEDRRSQKPAAGAEGSDARQEPEPVAAEEEDLIREVVISLGRINSQSSFYHCFGRRWWDGVRPDAVDATR